MVSVDTPLVEVTETDAIRTVELARPEKLNALTPELVAGLAEAFAAFQDDPGPGILLTGQGRATCAGDHDAGTVAEVIGLLNDGKP